jgi:hypothetical protein
MQTDERTDLTQQTFVFFRNFENAPTTAETNGDQERVCLAALEVATSVLTPIIFQFLLVFSCWWSYEDIFLGKET